MNDMRKSPTTLRGHVQAGADPRQRRKRTQDTTKNTRQADNNSEPEKPMQHVTRRAVLAGSVSAAALPLLSAKAASPPAGEQTPGIYRYRIGPFELAAAFMPADKLATPFTTLIVNTGQKLVLIDTGTGGQIAPSAGVLRANLVAAGIDPAAIDLIVISHFHPDHINGIKDKDNDLVFPNAEIMVADAEWA